MYSYCCSCWCHCCRGYLSKLDQSFPFLYQRINVERVIWILEFLIHGILQSRSKWVKCIYLDIHRALSVSLGGLFWLETKIEFWQWLWLSWWSGRFWHQRSAVLIQSSANLIHYKMYHKLYWKEKNRKKKKLHWNDENKEKEAGNSPIKNKNRLSINI